MLVSLSHFSSSLVPILHVRVPCFAPVVFLVYLSTRTNVVYSAYLPLDSSDTFNNVSQIINSDSDSSFNLQAYIARHSLQPLVCNHRCYPYTHVERLRQ
jgi:hypothetical protein